MREFFKRKGIVFSLRFFNKIFKNIKICFRRNAMLFLLSI